MRRLKVITWARWKIIDPIDNRFYTTFTVSVLKPSSEYPITSVAMSIVTSTGRLFMRFASLDALQQVFVVPSEYRQRLMDGCVTARQQAQVIIEQQKTMHRLADLAPGAQVIRTDTGEVIAEAERILNGNT